jgi:hypothetical protein
MYRRAIGEYDIHPDDYDDFVNTYYYQRACNCFINPPCAFCTHPGNDLEGERIVGEYEYMSDVQYNVLKLTHPEKVEGYERE